MLIYRHIFIINSENKIIDAFTCSLYKQKEKLHIKAVWTEWTPVSSQHSEQLKDALYVTDVSLVFDKLRH